VIFIDSNVFVIDLRYRRDRLFGVNRKFLELVRRNGEGVTTLTNLLEVAGVLSYNLNARQLRALMTHFPARYGVKVLPPPDPRTQVYRVSLRRLVEIIEAKCSLGDALMLYHVEQFATAGSTVVSWNAPHFSGRTTLTTVTPKEYLGG